MKGGRPAIGDTADSPTNRPRSGAPIAMAIDRTNPAAVINDLAAKMMVVEQTLHACLTALPADARKEIASDLRRRAELTMQEHAEGFLPAMDATFSLALAAALEALGEPPSR